MAEIYQCPDCFFKSSSVQELSKHKCKKQAPPSTSLPSTSSELLRAGEKKRTPEQWKDYLNEQLAKIDWSLRDCGCGHYRFVDNNGKITKLEYCNDSIRISRDPGDSWSVTFYLKDCLFETKQDHRYLDDAICIRGKGGKSIFILLHKWESETGTMIAERKIAKSAPTSHESRKTSDE